MKRSPFYISLIAMICFVHGLNAQNYNMIEVSGGSLDIGATLEQLNDAYPKEHPAHTVELATFYIGAFEVTQAQWTSVMGDAPSLNSSIGNDHPVDYVDWMSAIIFCNEASIQDAIFGINECVYYMDASFSVPFTKNDYDGGGNSKVLDVYIDYTKSGYRLPTESEWEFAARGGVNGQVTKYAGGNNLVTYGVFTDNSTWKSASTGTKAQNELGLFDMSGNVWEMVNDWYGPYISLPSVNPSGPVNGTHKVLRGGAYDFGRRMCRVSSRYMVLPDDRDSDIGFRLARKK